MNFAGVSLFSIVWSALRPGFYHRWWGMTLSLAAALVAVQMVEIWWSALSVLVAAAVLNWHSWGRRKWFAGAGDEDSTATNAIAGRRGIGPTWPERMNPIVGRGQTQHNLFREAQLIKAGVLWHLHGDRHGARGHCQDLLGKIRPDDPLFAEICNLYLCTCRTPPSRAAKPSVPLPAGFTKSMRPMPVTVGGAKIIPFKSPDVRISSTL